MLSSPRLSTLVFMQDSPSPPVPSQHPPPMSFMRRLPQPSGKYYMEQSSNMEQGFPRGCFASLLTSLPNPSLSACTQPCSISRSTATHRSLLYSSQQRASQKKLLRLRRWDSDLRIGFLHPQSCSPVDQTLLCGLLSTAVEPSSPHTPVTINPILRLTISLARVTNRHGGKRGKCHPLGPDRNFKAAFSCKQLLIIHLESQRQMGRMLAAQSSARQEVLDWLHCQPEGIWACADL